MRTCPLAAHAVGMAFWRFKKTFFLLKDRLSGFSYRFALFARFALPLLFLFQLNTLYTFSPDLLYV
jgi:hypothetical protein